MTHQVHQLSQRGNILATDTIYFEVDTPNTLASYVLLKDYYKSQSVATKRANKFKLIEASRKFLSGIQAKYGRLYCTYCGKPDLIIELEGMRVSHRKIATTDHIEAKSKGGALFDTKNFTCSCSKCNSQKDNMDVLEFLGYKK